MPPVLSYISFPASDNFVTEEAQVKSAIEELTQVNGIISSYYGLQVEEEVERKGALLSIWDSPESLKAFRDTSGAKFNSLIAGLSTGEIVRKEYVPVQRKPSEVFGAKVVEFAWGKAREVGAAAAFKKSVVEMSDKVVAAGHPSAVGESADGTVVIISGWDSPDEHWAFAKSADAGPLLEEITSLADISVLHFNLKKRGT